MGKYFGGSLDIGTELEGDIGPVIDDSDEDSAVDETFGDLIRQELSEGKGSKKKIEIAPAREVPKVEPQKEEKKEAQPKQKEVQQKKEVQAKKEAQKPRPAAPKKEARPAKKPERKEQPKIKQTPKKLLRPEVKAKKAPSASNPDSVPGKSGRTPGKTPGIRWLSMLMILLLAVGAVYAFTAVRAGKGAGASACAEQFVNSNEGAVISWADANAVDKFWLRQAFEANDPVQSQQILHMLACPDAFLSTVSSPANYANCETPQVYLVIDEDAVEDNIIAATDENSVLAMLDAEKEVDGFRLEYSLNGVRAWSVQSGLLSKINI